MNQIGLADKPVNINGHQRMLDRLAAAKEHAAEENRMSQERLTRRKRVGVDEAVRRLAGRLQGANVSNAIHLIDGLSTRERDYALLAEEYLGPNRKVVLQNFPKPRKSAREVYLQGATPTAADAAPVEPVKQAPKQRVKPKAEPQTEE